MGVLRFKSGRMELWRDGQIIALREPEGWYRISDNGVAERLASFEALRLIEEVYGAVDRPTS